MVMKIRKKPKEGPRGHYAVPLALVLAAAFGPRRTPRDYRRTIEDAGRLRAPLAAALGLEVIVADRPLAPEEFGGWNLRARPGKLAEMFGRGGTIPMGPPSGAFDGYITLLPLLALGRGQQLGRLEGLGAEFAELQRVALQNILAPALGLIPGYDLLLCGPPVHLRDLNGAIAHLDASLRDECDRAGVTWAPVPPLAAAALTGIPTHEPYSGTSPH
jgi:hypothetical protein